MGMSMGIDFENPMGMRMTCKNEYGCEYSNISPETAPRPSLIPPNYVYPFILQPCVWQFMIKNVKITAFPNAL